LRRLFDPLIFDGEKMFKGTLGAQPRRRAAVRAKFALILGALACLTPGLAQAQSPAKIEWEVYNRFRFYKDPQIFRDYLNVAKETAAHGAAEWVLNTEDALQAQPRNAEFGWAATETATQPPTGLKPESFCWSNWSKQYNNCGSVRDYILPQTIDVLARVTGDASRTSGICAWVLETPQGEKKPYSGACAGATVPVSYAGDATQASKLCIATKPNATDCIAGIASVEVKIRDYLIVGMGDSFGAGVGNPDIPARMQPHGENDLYYYRIHGVLSSSSHNFSGAPSELRRYLPARLGLNGDSGGDGQAQWLDIRCFRSQYGPQFRAALHLAAALKHNSVTYVDLACNGATVLQGLLAPKPLDPGFAPGLPAVPAQFEDAARVVCENRTKSWTVTLKYDSKFRPSDCGERFLCEYANPTLDLRPLRSATGLALSGNQAPTGQLTLYGCGDDGYRRPIDYVLLSIGGNDIGFASLVVQEALLQGTIDLDVLRGLLKNVFGVTETRDGAEKQLSFLDHIYMRLNEAFRTLMPVREHDLSRILLTAYPLPDGWEGTKSLCGEIVDSARRADDSMDATNFLGGFMVNGVPDGQKQKIVADVHKAACELDVWRMKWMDEAAGASGSMDDACAGVSPGDEPASKLQWRYVTGLVGKVWPHGFCAARNCSGPLDCAAENPKMPGFDSGRTIFGAPPPPQTSVPYDLKYYRPYYTRARWFRTFNDAYLTTSWQATLTDPSNVANALSALTTSAMHPTAEGYAAIADSLVQAIGADLCKRGEVDDAGKEIINFCPP
jgi:hypothetical protein